MILDGIVNVFLTDLGGLLAAVLPSTGAGLSLGTMSGFINGYAWIDGFLPIHEALSAAGIALSVTLVVFGFGLVRTIWSMIPGKFS